MLAVREALLLLLKSKWSKVKVIVLSDCLNVVTWLNSPATAPEMLKSQVKECLKIGNGIDWRIDYVPRDQNLEADKLAKKGIHSASMWCIDNSFEPGVT